VALSVVRTSVIANRKFGSPGDLRNTSSDMTPRWGREGGRAAYLKNPQLIRTRGGLWNYNLPERKRKPIL